MYLSMFVLLTVNIRKVFITVWIKLDFAVDCRSGSLQLLCEGLKLIRTASPESVGVQVFVHFTCFVLFTYSYANKVGFCG